MVSRRSVGTGRTDGTQVDTVGIFIRVLINLLKKLKKGLLLSSEILPKGSNLDPPLEDWGAGLTYIHLLYDRILLQYSHNLD